MGLGFKDNKIAQHIMSDSAGAAMVQMATKSPRCLEKGCRRRAKVQIPRSASKRRLGFFL